MGEAAETITKLPNKEVVFALWRRDIEISEKAASLAAEVRERVQTQVEIGNVNRPAYNIGKAAVRKSQKNEIAALEMIDHAVEYLLWARDFIRSQGHVGDLAEMAKAEPKTDSNVMPLDQARRAFEKNADKAPTPAQVDEQTEKRARSRKKAPEPEPETAGEQLRETAAQGDAHIRKLVKGEEPEPETQQDDPDSFEDADVVSTYKMT